MMAIEQEYDEIDFAVRAFQEQLEDKKLFYTRRSCNTWNDIRWGL